MPPGRTRQGDCPRRPLPTFDMHARLIPSQHPRLHADDLPKSRTSRFDEKRVQEFRRTFASRSPLSPSPTPPLARLSRSASPAGQHRAQGRPLPLDPADLFHPSPRRQASSSSASEGSARQLEQNKDMNLLEWSDPTDPPPGPVDTAAGHEEPRLVVTVDTSLAHLAGALGVPVWVAMPLPPTALAPRPRGHPWYPTMRLFRREVTHWPEVIERIATALAAQLCPPATRLKPPPPPDRRPPQRLLAQTCVPVPSSR